MYITDLSSNGLHELPHVDVKSEACILTHERRSANYQPNFWGHNFVESLTSEYPREYLSALALTLKKEFKCIYTRATVLSKLRFVDSITKLGLSNLLEKEIEDVVKVSEMEYLDSFEGYIPATALCLWILRQQGYNVAQDIFIKFMHEMGAYKKGISLQCKGLLDLLQASYMASESQNSMNTTNLISYEHLMDTYSKQDGNFSNQEAMALELPLHWRVQWFDIRQQIDAYAKENGRNEILLRLSIVNFNIVQATHQRDLRELSMWWRDLGLREKVSFARDRIVESFLWSTGVAFEPQYSSFRKWLTKVLVFVLVIDDIYDVYGSLEELECFTRAVDRWDCQEVEPLPECMKICIQALYDTMDAIAYDMENKKGLVGVHTCIRNGWTDFCKALLTEAQWYHKNHVPSLEEYLRSAWISSCGPLLSIIAILSAAPHPTEVLKYSCQENNGIVYNTSLVIRLSNDLGTSKAERERGDCPSSILCYMREFNVSEDKARGHIQDIIAHTWKRINGEFIRQHPVLQASADLIRNMARVAQFIYHRGDQYSAPSHVTRNKIKELLIDPCELS